MRSNAHDGAHLPAKDPIPVHVDVGSLVSEFEVGYGRGHLKKQCRICGTETQELIEALLARGAGPASIATFLRDKKLVEIGESSIERHRKLHMNKP